EVHHGQAAYLLIVHEQDGVTNVIEQSTGGRLLGHAIANESGLQILLRRHDAQDQVTVGDNADQLAGGSVGDDGQDTHVVLAHHAGGVLSTVQLGDAQRMVTHDLADLHTG